MTNPLIQNSRRFIPRESIEPLVFEVVNDLAKDILLGGYKKKIKHLKHILLDLKIRHLESPNGFIYCSRDKNSYQLYKILEPFRRLDIMPDPLISTLDRLVAAGMLEEYIGFQSGAGKDRSSYQTRYKPTPELIEYLDRIPDSAVRIPRFVEQEIILRSKVYFQTKNGGLLIKYKYYEIEDTPQTSSLINWVKFINSIYARHHFDIFRPVYADFDSIESEGLKTTEININLNMKYIYRIYNDNFNKGGRFYGAWWQNIPSELRRYITIDANPTIEVDYRGIHIAILYALEGIDYYASEENKDPYNVDGWERDDVKLLLQIVLNTSRRNVIVAYKDSMLENNLSPYSTTELSELISKFEEIHAPIKHYFYGNVGVYLQNLDAKIAESVLMNCMQLGETNAYGFNEKFVVLPIHDSFIVEARYEYLLKNAMKTAVSEAITNMQIMEGIEINQFSPKFKTSRVVDLRMLPSDLNMYDRSSACRYEKVLPELKFIRKHSRDNSINIFRLDNTYNELI